MTTSNKTSRRSFLTAAGGAAVLGSLAGRLPEPADGGTRDGTQSVRLERPSLPVLRHGDVVVVGGGFAGVAAALGFARAGRKTILVEPRTYLGREVTATLRPWLAGQESLPEIVRACTGEATATNSDGEIPLKPDAVKLELENLLLEAGVEFLYACYPLGACKADGELAGLIIGNKSGRQVLACSMIVDTTETAVIARTAGAAFQPPAGKKAVFTRTLEFDKLVPPLERVLAVDKDLGVVGDRVTVHRGYRGREHALVEAAFELPVEGFGPDHAMRREIEARNRTMRLAAFLVAKVPAFQKAFLAAGSYELHGPATTPVQGPTPEWTKGVPSVAVAGLGPLAGLAGPLRGLWCLPDVGEPVAAAVRGTAFAQTASAQWELLAAGAKSASAIDHTLLPATTAESLAVREPDRPQSGRAYETIPVAPADVPVVRTVDVLVVGGGTSGATAAATAAREGVKTLLVEMNPGLGGTGTIGAVDSYWFGRRVGFCARLRERVKAVHESLHYPASERKWNVEAKMFALLRQTQDAHAETLWPAIVVGAIVEDGNRVRGVIVATRYGLRAVLAKVVIDATGDGDVAAFAGAAYVKGSTMDHNVMWHAMAQYISPGRNRNSFTSSVDVTNIDDCQRAILAGRRRGQNCHDHGVYLAPRESRHILADKVLTLADQLRQRAWPDVVNIHRSNHDIKGKTCSAWLQAGLIPPHLEIEIPYSVLLPKGLENILVAGKAFSTNHDGLSAIRMQADLENLGGVVGLAAAAAVKENRTPRRIDVAALQRRLVAEGVLPPNVLTRQLKPRRHGDADLRRLVESLVADKPLLAYQNMDMSDVHRGPIPFVELCTAGPRIVPMLETALATAPDDRKIVIAQALAMYGSPAGVPVLIAAAQRLLAGAKLPVRTADILHAGMPPDQGAAPDVVYLIYSLGMTRDRRSLKIWRRVADLLDPREEDFKDSRLSLFCYVDAVCFGAERLGDPAAIPILEKLHACPTLRDLAVRKGFQSDFLPERRAMLELALGKALARCGSPRGFQVLIAYLDDNRAMLAEQAHANLARITGEDHGKDATAWSAWLDKAKDALRPTPLADDLDAAFEQDILTA